MLASADLREVPKGEGQGLDQVCHPLYNAIFIILSIPLLGFGGLSFL
jgi:hypothetical protein